jgi:hypothetical protein
MLHPSFVRVLRCEPVASIGAYHHRLRRYDQPFSTPCMTGGTRSGVSAIRWGTYQNHSSTPVACLAGESCQAHAAQEKRHLCYIDTIVTIMTIVSNTFYEAKAANCFEHIDMR